MRPLPPDRGPQYAAERRRQADAVARGQGWMMLGVAIMALGAVLVLVATILRHA